ncbi:hypothetical protein ACOI22_03505 [Glaciecola sp. 2405UD65-10]|uniref:hypothetical protein n=1 Tax=Glaciecola sp. 2405UD65-10 TaxID=3397244 RepID=UPI003B59DFE5
MYDNRKHVRDNKVLVRFNEDEIEAIRALAVLKRKQTAAFIYEMVLNQVNKECDHFNSKVV